MSVSNYWPVGIAWLTRRASGGALPARELVFDDLVVATVGGATLLRGAARQWPYVRWCFLPVG